MKCLTLRFRHGPHGEKGNPGRKICPQLPFPKARSGPRTPAAPQIAVDIAPPRRDNTPMNEEIVPAYPTPSPNHPLVARAPSFSSDHLDAVVDALYRALLESGMEEVHDQISYCLRELVENAVRANRKRAVFLKAGLDVANPADYAKGLILLRDSPGDDPSPEPSPHDGHVEILLSKSAEHILLRVSNTAEMVEAERARVSQRLSAAQLYETFDEVFEQVEDDSESAGLGLVMLGMILRRLGVPDDGIRYSSQNGLTVFEILVPLNLVTDEESDNLTDALLKEIQSIPQIPQNVHSLRDLIRNPDVDYKALARLIRKDPALALEVLRMANSPVYRRSQRIETCEVAVGLIGLRGLRGILDSFGARKALEGHYPAHVLDHLWEHSARVAELAAAIGRQLAFSESAIEAAYVGGLLHDVGRIVLEGRNPDAYRALQQFCANKQTSAAAAEGIIAGVNHTRIGARMAEHWNLPERLVQTIRYSRAPLSAPKSALESAQLVFLSHPVSRRLDGEAKEYDVDSNVLSSFGLDVPGGLDGLAERVRLAVSPPAA